MFKFPLGIELDGQFGENDDVVMEQSFITPALHLRTRPSEPLWILRQNVSDGGAGIDQNHSSHRVNFSQSAVLPLIFPPRRSVASARRARGGLPSALTTEDTLGLVNTLNRALW